MSIEEQIIGWTWMIGYGGFALLCIAGSLVSIFTPSSKPDPDPIKQNLLDASRGDE